MKDASEMTDDELTKVIATGVEPESSGTPETVEPTEESVGEPTEEASPDTEETVEPEQEEETPETPEEKPPSRREQLRVQSLLKKYGPPPVPQKSEPEAHDYRQVIDAEDEVINTLETDRQTYGQEQRTQGRQETLSEVQSVKWETLLHVDAPVVEAKYKVLDPNDKENFHPALSDALTNRYLNEVGYDDQTGLVKNPNLRWKDFVEAEFELADEIANTRIAATTKNIAQQTAQTGLRPDGGQAKRLNLNQAPENMTDEELYAALGQTPPKK